MISIAVIGRIGPNSNCSLLTLYDQTMSPEIDAEIIQSGSHQYR
jgi:hypothetical protein